MIPANETVNVYRNSTTNLLFKFFNEDDTLYDLSQFEKAEIAIFEAPHRETPQSVHEAVINNNEVSLSFTPAESSVAFRYDYPKIEVRFYIDSENFYVYFVGDINVLTPYNISGEVESNSLIVHGNTIINTTVQL